MVVLLSLFLVSAPCKEFALYELRTLDAEFTSYEEERVALRGFLFIDEEGNTILAGEPSKPSCCLGKEEDRSIQVFVEGIRELPSRERAVTVEGILSRRSTMDREGKRIQQFELRDAYLAQPALRQGGWKTFLWLSLVLGALTLAIFGRRNHFSFRKRGTIEREIASLSCHGDISSTK